MLFDHYSAFDLSPPRASRCRWCASPAPRIATALGGGYIASGPPRQDRAARARTSRAGCASTRSRAAGEVQTPLLGEAAAALSVGDRVYFRHAKAGELCERFDSLHVVEGGRITDELPTYRGEGKAFL